jgi:hypothetical protein
MSEHFFGSNKGFEILANSEQNPLPSGEVNAVIPNTPEVELKAEKINQQVAAWFLNY